LVLSVGVGIADGLGLGVGVENGFGPSSTSFAPLVLAVDSEVLLASGLGAAPLACGVGGCELAGVSATWFG
jgi:hypothetical protein